MLLPSLLWLGRAHAHGLLHSCTRTFPDLLHTRRFLDQKKTGNLHKLDDAKLVRLLRAPQDSATSTC